MFAAARVDHPVELLAEQLDSGALLSTDTCFLSLRHMHKLNTNRMNAIIT